MFASFDIGIKHMAVYVEKEEKCHKIEVFDITGKTINDSLHNLSLYLTKNKEIFDQCSLILVEKQLKVNNLAGRIEHHLISWFIITYENKLKIVSMPPKDKTQQFDAPKMTKYQRKKWAINKAKELFFSNDEVEALYTLETHSKADDMADAYLQCEAYKIKMKKKMKS